MTVDGLVFPVRKLLLAVVLSGIECIRNFRPLGQQFDLLSPPRHHSEDGANA